MSSDDVIGQVSAALRYAVPHIRPSWIVGYEGPEVRYSMIGSAEGPRRFPDLFDIDLGPGSDMKSLLDRLDTIENLNFRSLEDHRRWWRDWWTVVLSALHPEKVGDD